MYQQRGAPLMSGATNWAYNRRAAIYNKTIANLVWFAFGREFWGAACGGSERTPCALHERPACIHSSRAFIRATAPSSAPSVDVEVVHFYTCRAQSASRGRSANRRVLAVARSTDGGARRRECIAARFAAARASWNRPSDSEPRCKLSNPGHSRILPAAAVGARACGSRPHDSGGSSLHSPARVLTR